MANTLNELLGQVTTASENHKAAIEAAETEYQETILQIKQAKEEAEKAASDGDAAAFETANRKEQYNRKRSETLLKVKVSPYYTAEQVDGIIEEGRELFKAETRPMYKRLHEIAEEWDSLVEQLRQKEETTKRINKKLISSVGYENHKAYGRPELAVGSHVSTLGKAITHYIRSAIEYHYKPEKEA